MVDAECAGDFYKPQLVAEVLDDVVGPYTQYDLYCEARQVIETIVPLLTPDSVELTDFNAVIENYSFGSIGNIGVNLKRTVFDEKWDRAKFDSVRYELQFQPLLDEYTNNGLPISYIGFLFDDATYTRELFKEQPTKHQPRIQYRKIGAPIILDSEPMAAAGEDDVTRVTRQVAAYILASGAHGGEEFRATRSEDAVKLCLSLADELREVGVEGLSEKWRTRLAAVYANKERLANVDESANPRETDLGRLSFAVDQDGVLVGMASSLDTPPFLGYRLSKDEAGELHLENLNLIGTDSVNDMDAVVFEQLLRLHTTNWIPFTEAQ
jgi:hypothetical protein